MSKTLQTVLNIKRDSEGLYSLTDIFKQAQKKGMAEGKQSPAQWSRFEGKAILEHAHSLNECKSHIIKTARGKGGGTLAIPEIALAYAKYLSPELHMLVNQTFLRAQSGDVTLADEIVDRATPNDVQLHMVRTAGKVTRNEFTSTLRDHGVYDWGFGTCTNAIYIPILGGDAKELRKSRNLPTKANVRAAMTAQEIIMTAHAEMIAARDIINVKALGNNDCVEVCSRAARRVAAL